MVKLIIYTLGLLLLPFFPTTTYSEVTSDPAPASSSDLTSSSNAQLDPTPVPIDVKHLWKTVEEHIEDIEFDSALESLEIIRQHSYHYDDDENLIKSLLTIVSLHIQNTDYESSLDLLYESALPKDINLRALVIMLRAYCIRHYFQENAYVIAQNTESEETDDFRTWTKFHIINACLEDFYHAWQHRIYLGIEAYDQYVTYFNYWNIVFGTSPTVRDYLTFALADFLADPSTWSEEEYKQTKKLNSVKMKTEPFKYAKQVNLSPDTLSHPIEQIIYIFRDLANWHEDSSALSKAVHARTRCTVLVKRAFRKHHMATQSLKNIQNTFDTNPVLPDDLETIKSNLKKRLSW